MSLKPGRYLILTTPNIASLFRRFKLLLGRQPIYRYHVREYTMSKVLAMLEKAGFMPVEFYYSAVNDMTYVDAEPEGYKRLRSYADSGIIYHLCKHGTVCTAYVKPLSF
ncbi:MAG: hypothetical protein ACO2O1_05775 [Candidatus Caldarchaeales archaeon]|jgi:hypothetical protein